MAAVLLMVGRGEEQPDIVQTLLDTQRCPRKPQFAMASGAEARGHVGGRVGGLGVRLWVAPPAVPSWR